MNYRISSYRTEKYMFLPYAWITIATLAFLAIVIGLITGLINEYFPIMGLSFFVVFPILALGFQYKYAKLLRIAIMTDDFLILKILVFKKQNDFEMIKYQDIISLEECWYPLMISGESSILINYSSNDGSRKKALIIPTQIDMNKKFHYNMNIRELLQKKIAENRNKQNKG